MQVEAGLMQPFYGASVALVLGGDLAP